KIETPISLQTSEPPATPTVEEIATIKERFSEFVNLDADPRLKEAIDSLTPSNTGVLVRSPEGVDTYTIPISKVEPNEVTPVEYSSFYSDKNHTPDMIEISL